MPPQSVSLNTPINARVRKIVMEMDAMPSLRTSNSLMTDMYGSGRVEKYVANGNSGSYPSSAARDYQAVSGKPDRLVDVSVGGGVKMVVKRMPKPVKEALVKEAIKSMAGGKISRSKKAKKWTDYAVDTAKKGIGLASMAKALGGAKPKMAKGSPEMKAHMARLRAMRKK